MEPRPITPKLDSVEAQARVLAQRFPDLAHRANGRIEKAIDLAASGYVSQEADDPFLFYVQSQTGEGGYLVDAKTHTCGCEDHLRFSICKHRIAAYLAVAAL